MDAIKYRIDGLLTVLISSNGKLGELRGDYLNRIAPANQLTEYRFSDAGSVTLTDPLQATLAQPQSVKANERVPGLPVVFETPIYFFDIQFDSPEVLTGLSEETIEVRHHLNDVSKRFYRRGRMLFAEMSYVNEPGKFRLEISFVLNGTKRTVWLEFFVASTKMDVKGDYKRILEIVERHQRESLFTPYAKTVQDVNVGQRANEFGDPYWTVYFDHALDRYERALKRIIYEPHKTTVGVPYVRRADRVRNWTTTMAREFARYRGDAGALMTHGFVEQVRTSTFDTPENRFVKMTLEALRNEFSSARAKIDADKQLSSSFKKEFAERLTRFERYLREPLMRSVARQQGAVMPSLVLQMRPGYADIRIVWDLIHGMFTTEDALSRSTEAGLIKISALYEYWCFLEVKRILAGEDANEQQTNPIPKLNYKWTEADNASKSMHDILKETALDEDAQVTSVAYQCKDDNGKLLAEVIYQQSYGPNDVEQYSRPVQQRPDIVVRFYGKNSVPYTYLFDAKYQIDNGKYSSGKDAVPRASLDQMHRYRDAILWRNSNGRGASRPSHEVVGAYVLYPADETDVSRLYTEFDDLRKEQNIGAFPMLPGKTSKFDAFIRELVDHIEFDSTRPEWLKKDAIPQKGLNYVIGNAVEEDAFLTLPHDNEIGKKWKWLPPAKDQIWVCADLLVGKNPSTVKFVSIEPGYGPNERTKMFKVEFMPPGGSDGSAAFMVE